MIFIERSCASAAYTCGLVAKIGDRVFDAERWERALEEAEGCLWATQAEYLGEMMDS